MNERKNVFMHFSWIMPNQYIALHTGRQPRLGFFLTSSPNSTIGPLYTFIGTRKSHLKNPKNLALQMAAPTVRGGTGPSGSPKNQLFSKSFVTKCVTSYPQISNCVKLCVPSSAWLGCAHLPIGSLQSDNSNCCRWLIKYDFKFPAEQYSKTRLN